MRRAYVVAVAISLLAPLAGCGGAEAPLPPVTAVEHTVGSGADRTWVVAPSRGDPRSVVVFLHGLGDQKETTPVHHRPWLDHLARSGNYVLYPRYELYPGAARGLKHAVLGTLAALKEVDPKHELPLVLVGYSRGGGMAVAIAALAPALGLAPKAVLGVFPADMEPTLDYTMTPPGLEVVFLVGDMDTVVGDVGARRLAARLLAAGFPSANVRMHVVHSPPGFQATHLSVLSDSDEAQRAFWVPADRLIASARN
jgi:predicted esterase